MVNDHLGSRFLIQLGKCHKTTWMFTRGVQTFVWVWCQCYEKLNAYDTFFSHVSARTLGTTRRWSTPTWLWTTRAKWPGCPMASTVRPAPFLSSTFHLTFKSVPWSGRRGHTTESRWALQCCSWPLPKNMKYHPLHSRRGQTHRCLWW